MSDKFNNNTTPAVRNDSDGTHAQCVEPLGAPGVARQLAAGVATANIELTATCRRISIHARGDAIRFEIASGAPVSATAVSHYIASGERLDFVVSASSFVSAIRVTNDAVLEITELV
jgi:hypothetical protein